LKLILDFSHTLGFEKIEGEIERMKSDSTKVKISYLEYLNASQHHKTELAIENLHKFFDQNLKFLFSIDRVKSLDVLIDRANLTQTKSDKPSSILQTLT
jgi:hypothetical protein